MSIPTPPAEVRSILRATPPLTYGDASFHGGDTPLIVTQQPSFATPEVNMPGAYVVEPRMPHVSSTSSIAAERSGAAGSRVRFGSAYSTVSFNESAESQRRPSLPQASIPRSCITDEDALAEKAPEADRASAASDGSNLSFETTTSAASSARIAARSAGITRLKLCGTTFRISFVTWTFVAMAVPIIFLIAATASNTAEAAEQLRTIKRHVPLAVLGSDCVSAISEEHAQTLRFVLQRDSASEAAMHERRAAFLRQCTDLFQTELLLVRADNDAFVDAFRDWTVAARDIAVMRERIDASGSVNATATQRQALSSDLREAFDATARTVTDAIALVADVIRTDATRFFLNIKLSADMRKSIWTAIAATLVVAGSSLPPTMIADQLREAQASHSVARASLRALRGIASPVLRSDVREWDARPEVRAFWGITGTITDSYPRITQDEFWRAATVTMAFARDIEHAQIARLSRATSATSKLAENASLMLVGISACVVAAALLSRQQLRTKAQLEDQVDRVEKTRRAVSAFVPKFFLSKMGYTSITQVQVGECTDVALTMLFSDVRRFTTVAEGMSSSVLFQWVQVYFRRMTAVVETHHGNINQFIGDALFAVFSTCGDAVACAVDMQSDAQQLNIGRICQDNNSVPIEIGVGLHHDVLAMGILGDEHRHTCTAISASVNLASRLEGLTKQLGCRILASEAVMAQLSAEQRAAVAHRRIGPAVVKGSSHGVVIYDVFQTDESALLQYKHATKNNFERYVRAVLVRDDPLCPPEAAGLRAELEAAAREHGTEDAVLAQIDRCRCPKTGSMVFDEK